MKAKKNSSENLKSQQKRALAEDELKPENLGLDADHSSDVDYQYLNNDNDMVSGNKEGENDKKSNSEGEGHSPLMDK